MAQQGEQAVRYVRAEPGEDLGAQINAAYESLPASGGRIVVIGEPGGRCYSFSTPIVANVAGKYLQIEGGSHNRQLVPDASMPACLDYTRTAGAAITLDYVPPTGTSPSVTHGLKNLTITNNRCMAVGGCGSNAVGVTVGVANGGAAGGTFSSVKLIGFGTGFAVPANAQRVLGGEIVFRDCAISYNGTGVQSADPDGQQLTFDTCHIEGNGTGVWSSTSLRISNSWISSNSRIGVTCSAPASCDFDDDYFENATVETTHFVEGNGTFFISGGEMRDDATAGSTDWWMHFAGASFLVFGTALTSRGRTASSVILNETSGYAFVQNNSSELIPNIYSNPQPIPQLRNTMSSAKTIEGTLVAKRLKLLQQNDASGGIDETNPFPGIPTDTVARTREGLPRPPVSRKTLLCNVKDYGAVGDFSHDDTAVINTAIAACAVKDGTVYFPSGVYKAVPATKTADESGPIAVAFPMRSNMHIRGEMGATIKLADNQSTDDSPKNIALFFTNGALANISFYGITMDMNGAHNTISPGRPAKYERRFNMAHISVSGTPGGIAAKVDHMSIENCQFLNSSGASAVVAGQSNKPNIVLGSGWTVKNNLFMNNGSDTDDHSTVYGWSNDMIVDHNTFQEDSPYGTAGRTGGTTAFEVHGSNQQFYSNRIINYVRGVFLANNYTSTVSNTDIHDNTFLTGFFGVDVFNSSGATTIQQAAIHDNFCSFSDDTYSGAPQEQICINVSPAYAVSDIDIERNSGVKNGTNIGSAFVVISPQLNSNQPLANIRVNQNSSVGFGSGIQFRTNASNGLGYVEAKGNQFIGNTPAGVVTGSTGIYADATGTIQMLVIDRNAFIDERGVRAEFQDGIYLQSGTIKTLMMGPQIFRGLTRANYTETGGITIVNRKPL